MVVTHCKIGALGRGFDSPRVHYGRMAESGLRRRTGNAVHLRVTGVRIPLLPPFESNIVS